MKLKLNFLNFDFFLALPTPENLQIEAVDEKTVVVHWELKLHPDVYGYKVSYLKQSDEGSNQALWRSEMFDVKKCVNLKICNLTIENLSPQTDYMFKVNAYGKGVRMK